MLRKTFAALAISFAAVAGAVALPAAAQAAPTVACTATGLLSSLRIWHVSYRPNGSVIYNYNGAYAARCDSAGEQTNTIDLTRDEDEKLTSFDLRCGTTNFTNLSTTYTYVGSRSSSGDTFRYWGTRIVGGTFIGYGVTAARCE